MTYHRVLDSGIIITNTQPPHFAGIRDVHGIVYPNLVPDGVFQPEHLQQHRTQFPAGQFVALDGEKVVGFTATFRTHLSPEDDPLHDWYQTVGGYTLANHQPDGAWVYGAELGIHPDYRQRGIATALYEARFELVRTLGLKGYYTVGLLVGYRAYQDQMTLREYGAKVMRRELDDPTLTMQMNRGFRPVALVENYIGESIPGIPGAGVLIVWENTF